MQQTAATLGDAIAALEGFRTRTGMCIFPVDVAHTRSFLHGLGLGLNIFGVRPDSEISWQVQRDRGWQQRAVGPVPPMVERGMTPRQIIDELIDIEALRRFWPAV